MSKFTYWTLVAFGVPLLILFSYWMDVLYLRFLGVDL